MQKIYYMKTKNQLSLHKYFTHGDLILLYNILYTISLSTKIGTYLSGTKSKTAFTLFPSVRVAAVYKLYIQNGVTFLRA